MTCRRALTAMALMFGALLVANDANAYSGFVTGWSGFWLMAGNFCDPAVQDCTGARYLRQEYDSIQPIRNGEIWIVQGSNIIGYGTTDSSGTFTTGWSSGDISTPASVWWVTRHAEGRFFIANTIGQLWAASTPQFTLWDGTTYENPQDNGGWYVGSSSTGCWPMDLFWQAEMQWRESFSLVGRLLDVYTGVEVRGVTPSIPGYLESCNTSCANGPSKRILIGVEAQAFAPQARMMHEAGHVASYLINPREGGLDYNYPYTGGGGSWSFDWPEWAAVSFEEGFATMMADTTLWAPNAVQPTSCASSSNCPVTESTQLELSHYPFETNYCSQTEPRWPLSVMRFLWDVYDDHYDCDGDWVSEGLDGYWHMYSNLLNYPPGINDHEIEEPYATLDHSQLDDRDGRGANDYVYHYMNAYTADSISLWYDNCLPP